MEAFGDAFLNQGRENIRNDREQNDRKKKESIAKEGEEKNKEKQRNPGDAGKCQKEHDREERQATECDESTEATFGKEEEIESTKDNHSKEVEAIDVRMTKGTKDAKDRHIFIEQSDMEYELIQAKGYRENTREKEGLEEMFEVASGLYGGVSEESERKEIEQTQEFLEGVFWIQRIEKSGYSPEKNDEERKVERKRRE